MLQRGKPTPELPFKKAQPKKHGGNTACFLCVPQSPATIDEDCLGDQLRGVGIGTLTDPMPIHSSSQTKASMVTSEPVDLDLGRMEVARDALRNGFASPTLAATGF